MRFRYLLILLIPFLSFGMSISQRFIDHINSFRLLKIEFIQKFYPIGYQTPIVSEGDAYIENNPPFRIKIHYKKPNPFIILYNGKSTILYNLKENNTYTSKGMSKEIESIGIFNKRLTDIFKPVLSSKNGKYYKILFIPKTKGLSSISYIILKVNNALNPISAYVYILNKGVLYIDIKSLENLKSSENVFRLK